MLAAIITSRLDKVATDKQLIAANYVTYLPSVEELERELERDRRFAESVAQIPHPAKTKRGKRAPSSKGRK